MFCSACAAPIEAGVVACPKCGEPVPTIAVPPHIEKPRAVEKPRAIILAGKLLWTTIALGLVGTVYFVAHYGSGVLNANFLIFDVLETVAWIAAVVFTLRRSKPARVVLLLLVVYSVLNTVRNVSLYPVQLDFTYILWLLELCLRIAAGWLLLRPDSNAWFRANDPKSP
jgi:hypothetical protein